MPDDSPLFFASQCVLQWSFSTPFDMRHLQKLRGTFRQSQGDVRRLRARFRQAERLYRTELDDILWTLCLCDAYPLMHGWRGSLLYLRLQNAFALCGTLLGKRNARQADLVTYASAVEIVRWMLIDAWRWDPEGVFLRFLLI